MASPQKDKGYTSIAHELLEAIIRTQLTTNESKVLWTIIRKTYGYQKKTDGISLSQFQQATGLHRPSVHRALKYLKSRNIIQIERLSFKNRTVLFYSVQKDYEKWDKNLTETEQHSFPQPVSSIDTMTGIKQPSLLVSPHVCNMVSSIDTHNRYKDNTIEKRNPQPVDNSKKEVDFELKNEVIILLKLGYTKRQIKTHPELINKYNIEEVEYILNDILLNK